MGTFDREPRSVRPGKPTRNAKHLNADPLTNETKDSADSATQAMLHLQSTIGNQAVLRMLRAGAEPVKGFKGAIAQREPHPDAGSATQDAGTQAPAQKQPTLKSEGKDAKDPVYKDTAQIVD